MRGGLSSQGDGSELMLESRLYATNGGSCWRVFEEEVTKSNLSSKNRTLAAVCRMSCTENTRQ